MTAFWEFSVTRYAWPGVETAALDLQDRQGFDVNIALWCVWLAAQGRAPGPALEKAVEIAHAWTGRITGPVRKLRLRFKGEADAGPVYKAMLAAELEAERLLQARLAKLLPETGVTEAAPRPAAQDGLMAYATLINKAGDFDAFLSAVFPAGKTV